jgi:hypothetical protein
VVAVENVFVSSALGTSPSLDEANEEHPLDAVCCRQLVNGQIRYATALGETDTAGGWRANKDKWGKMMSALFLCGRMVSRTKELTRLPYLEPPLSSSRARFGRAIPFS